MVNQCVYDGYVSVHAVVPSFSLNVYPPSVFMPYAEDLPQLKADNEVALFI